MRQRLDLQNNGCEEKINKNNPHHRSDNQDNATTYIADPSPGGVSAPEGRHSLEHATSSISEGHDHRQREGLAFFVGAHVAVLGRELSLEQPRPVLGAELRS